MEGRSPHDRLVVQPFDEAARDFLKWAEGEYRQHPSTHRRLATSFANLRAFLGNVPVGAVTEGMLEDFKFARRKNAIKEVAFRHDLYALSKFFQYAIRQRWAARNPVRSLEEMPSAANAIRIHVLTAEEQEVYFKAATGDLRDLGRLMLNQGCRPEELLGLRHSDVDLLNRKLRIQRGKTKATTPTLTLTQESIQISARRLNNGSRCVFPSPKCPGPPIRRLNSQHDAVLYKLNHVKVGGESKGKPAEEQVQFVLYDFRHTFATRLAEKGVDLPSIAAILGHSGLRIVGRYVHPTAQHLEEAMLRYDAGLLEAQKGRASFGPVTESKTVN